MFETQSFTCDKFSDDSVGFLAASSGTVLARGIHFSFDTDEISAKGFVETIFGELISGVDHIKLEMKSAFTLFY